mmetsp:Transcript_16642/g.35190  ORF Transcript_16642/g.35190 Transcript_16642/m.35190 type:complete len:251 (+) Transcript_16642:75-827(+)
MDLSDPHKAQVARFISFFKGKRERVLSDRTSEKDEFKMDRLSDPQAIFNTMDVEDLLETYHAQICGSMREALEGFINISAVHLSQVLLQAQQHGMVLDGADVASIEDQHAVDQIASFSAMGLAPPVTAKRTTLPTLGAAGTADPAAMQKVAELELENSQMRERYQMMQQQVSELLRERSQLVAQCEQAGGAAPVPAPAQRLGSDSTQFKELKAIVKKKSMEVKELRNVLISNGLPLPNTGGGVELQAEDD